MGVFFFFQAEDGIRDVAVTGVQTCALPILQRSAPSEPAFGKALPDTADCLRLDVVTGRAASNSRLRGIKRAFDGCYPAPLEDRDGSSHVLAPSLADCIPPARRPRPVRPATWPDCERRVPQRGDDHRHWTCALLGRHG